MRIVALAMMTCIVSACETGGGGTSGPRVARAPVPAGSPTPIHDPAIIEQDGQYYVFCTGPGIPIWRSRDLRTWRRVGRVYAEDVPAWASERIEGARDVWAPDVRRVGDRLVLTYAVSRFGSKRSVIGAAEIERIDPKDPGAGWRDRGMVVESREGDDFNAIDPNIVETPDGRVFLAYGSSFGGIRLVRLDPRRLRVIEDGGAITIASRSGGRTIEAPFIVERDGLWYLFVSFDACCRGVESTYNVRVGRAERLKGPYVDRDGRAMLEGGGTMILGGGAGMAGPGHCSIIEVGGEVLLAHHYYDMAGGGRPTLGIRRVRFDDDGWVSLGPEMIRRER